MALSAIRKIPLAALLMLGCSAMTVPAQAGWFDFGSKSADVKPAAKPDTKTDNKVGANEPATNLEDSIRQAQLLRLAGQYPEAIRHLSQLMMVASDDGHVIAEYGKTLAAMGRPSDAVNFLTRAEQLQPGDWTILSALGVAYDQIGDQKSAQQAYEHALAIKPEESSVLNNYALSRMLAKDPDMARKLAQRAESAGGNSDIKIARNIALIHSLAVEAPAPIATAVAAQAPQAAPQTAVAHNQIPGPTPTTAQVAHNTAPQAAEARDNRVVMQRVPVDPLAGPVQPAKTTATVATQAPHPLQPLVQSKTAETAKPVAPLPAPVVKAAEASKPVPVTASIASAPVKTADTKPAPAKTAEAAKPVATTPSAAPVVKAAEASKPVPVTASNASAPVKTADTKPAPAKTAEAAKPAATTPSAAPVVKAAQAAKPAATTPSPAPVVKAAEASKPIPVPSLASLKTADTKPASAKTAEAAKPAATTPSTVPVVKAAEAGKPVPVTAAPAPVKTADTKPAPAKTAEAAKPVATTPSTVPVVKAAEASKPVPVTAAPVKMADTKPAPAKTAEAAKPAAVVTLKMAPPPVKAADAGKPAPAPKVLAPEPVKAAAKAKDAIPGLRLSANAY